MLQVVLKIVVALSLAGASTFGWAQVDRCDDYLARHFRKDLKPMYLVYKEPLVNGKKKTFVFLIVKNTGEVDLNSNFANKTMKVSVSPGWNFTAQFGYSVPSGFTRMIQLGQVPNGTFKNCSAKYVQIDTSRTVGQWGCQVFSNDKKMVPVYKRAPGHIPCRYLRIPQPHRPVPRFRPKGK